MRGKERKRGKKGEGRKEEKEKEKVNHNLENKVAIVSMFKDIGKHEHTEGTNGGSVKKWKYSKEFGMEI